MSVRGKSSQNKARCMDRARTKSTKKAELHCTEIRFKCPLALKLGCVSAKLEPHQPIFGAKKQRSKRALAHARSLTTPLVPELLFPFFLSLSLLSLSLFSFLVTHLVSFFFLLSSCLFSFSLFLRLLLCTVVEPLIIASRCENRSCPALIR